MSTPRTPVERILARVESIDGCLVWLGARTAAGYGAIGVGTKAEGNRRTVFTHRVIWEAQRGPIESGLTIDHLCRNRACVNVEHLEPVSNAENNRRGTSPSAANARKVRCSRNHPFDEANTHWRADGRGRECRTCRRLTMERYLARRRGVAA